MFGEARGLVSVAKDFQPQKMIAVERVHRTDGKTDAVNRQGITLAQCAQLCVRRAACAHVIFGVDLYEGERLPGCEQVLKMLRLVSNACARGQGSEKRHAATFRKPVGTHGGRAPRRTAQDLIGVREPFPFGVFMEVQVPFGTYFQALP